MDGDNTVEILLGRTHLNRDAKSLSVDRNYDSFPFVSASGAGFNSAQNDLLFDFETCPNYQKLS